MIEQERGALSSSQATQKSTFVFAAAVVAIAIFCYAFFVYKTPYQMKAALRTPITITANRDGNGILYNLRTTIDGEAVSCEVLKHEVYCPYPRHEPKNQ